MCYYILSTLWNLPLPNDSIIVSTPWNSNPANQDWMKYALWIFNQSNCHHRSSILHSSTVYIHSILVLLSTHSTCKTTTTTITTNTTTIATTTSTTIIITTTITTTTTTFATDSLLTTSYTTTIIESTLVTPHSAKPLFQQPILLPLLSTQPQWNENQLFICSIDPTLRSITISTTITAFLAAVPNCCIIMITMICPIKPNNQIASSLSNQSWSQSACKNSPKTDTHFL